MFLERDPIAEVVQPSTDAKALALSQGLIEQYHRLVPSRRAQTRHDRGTLVRHRPPSSRERTWDLILTASDWDISRIDAALDATFSLCNVNPARIGVVGFSDGGTYAIALGLSNGDLFRRIVSFAPGFLADVPRVGKPPLYIVRGTNDAVLTIDETRNVIVPRLRSDGYEVNYHEFTGGHVIPAALAPEALAWVIGGA